MGDEFRGNYPSVSFYNVRPFAAPAQRVHGLRCFPRSVADSLLGVEGKITTAQTIGGLTVLEPIPDILVGRMKTGLAVIMCYENEGWSQEVLSVF